MLDISPVPNQLHQGGVSEQTSPKPLDSVQNVQAVRPVGQDEVQTDAMLDALKEEVRPKRPEDVRPEQPEDLLSKEQEEGLLERMKALSDAAQKLGHHLSFELHEESEQMVVQVLDAEGELIRQIPPEEFLTLFERLEEMRGALFDTFV